MRRQSHASCSIALALILITASWLDLATPVFAQISPGEHAANNHPGQAAGGSPAATPGSAGGMGRKPEMAGPPEGVGGSPPEGAGGMMEKMGAPKPKEMYVKLMDLPDLPMEELAAIEQERISG